MLQAIYLLNAIFFLNILFHSHMALTQIQMCCIGLEKAAKVEEITKQIYI